jgi:hypothetical protein
VRDGEFEELAERLAEIEDPAVLFRVYELLTEAIPGLKLEPVMVIERTLVSRQLAKDILAVLKECEGGSE